MARSTWTSPKKHLFLEVEVFYREGNDLINWRCETCGFPVSCVRKENPDHVLGLPDCDEELVKRVLQE